jgi:carbohydrate-selective porin OprB
MANQALWRVHPKEARGLDATLSYDWSLGNLNRNNTVLTAGLRFNEPLPVRMHNTMSVGYVRNGLSQQFLTPGAPPFHAEQGVEFNALLDVAPMVLLQPVVQYYANPSGGTGHDVVVGFRAKVDF